MGEAPSVRPENIYKFIGLQRRNYWDWFTSLWLHLPYSESA